jgi:hypothetical protein
MEIILCHYCLICSLTEHMHLKDCILTTFVSIINIAVRVSRKCPDPCHFGTDPNPQIFTSDKQIRIRVPEAQRLTDPDLEHWILSFEKA